MSRHFFLLKLVFFYIHMAKAESHSAGGFISALEKKLEFKFIEYAVNISKWFEEINDRHLNNSELGRLLHYNEMKNKFVNFGEGRNLKKMSMSLLPIIFHMGAASTWGVLTTILAAKSVLIGVILLVFKIAVSSAKVASFFTAWKVKNHHHHHDEHSWIPQQAYPSDVYHSYKPHWPQSEYKSMRNSYESETIGGDNTEEQILY